MGFYDGRKIDLVALDVEGCITPADRGPWDLRGVGRIRRYCEAASQNGLPPAILVTGRAAPYAEAVIQVIGALGPAYDKVPSVAENGAMLWYHNRRVGLPAETAKNKLKEMRAVRRFVDEELGKIRGFYIVEPGKEICLSLDPFETEVEKLYENVLEELRRAGFMEDVEVTHSSSAVDITPKGVNKWSGLQQVLEESGIEKENVLGVGDSVGDASWLSHVGHKTAPANATEDLRALRLDYVSRKTEAKGVADILNHFICRPAGV